MTRDPITGKIVLLESDIREAMKYTKSNAAAARYLKISYIIYRKWAKKYIDSESGKSLFEVHLNPTGVGIPNYENRGRRPSGKGNKVYSLKQVLNNEVPNYPVNKLKHRLWRAGYKTRECESCGFSETRITDGEVPLTVAHKNGDRGDYSLENLEILCYNCYFLQVGNPWGIRRWDYVKNGAIGQTYRINANIENAEVDEYGNPLNIEEIGTLAASEIDPEEFKMDDITNSNIISKDEIEDIIRGQSK